MNTETLHKAIENAAELNSEQIALKSSNEAAVTYEEMNHRANQLANFILSRVPKNSEPQQIIGIYLTKSNALYISILATLKAGAAYVPLDPSFPEDRLRNVVLDSGASIILTTFDEPVLEGLGADIINIDQNASEIQYHSKSNPIVSMSETDLAYIYFTSGSTGRPKGVMVEHRNVVNYAKWAKDAFSIHPGRTTLQFTTINFDLAVSDIFSTLMFGGTLFFPTDDERLSYPAISKIIDEFKINIWMVAPGYLFGMPVETFPSLEVVIVAGEVCAPETIDSWSKGRVLFNGYGPTECTVLSTMNRLTSGDQCRNIGKPVANLNCHILDKNLKPVKENESGELFVSGESVARGYINQHTLTDERFIACPYSPEKRMYKTGDIVKLDTTGDLIFIGRNDRQVKIRGYRIELGEIESALNSIGYSKAIALLVEIKEEKKLIAHVIRSSSLSSNRAMEKLKAYLPDYMQPNFIVEHEAFPINLVGKVDLASLKAMTPNLESKARDNKLGSKTELELASIWADILNVGIDLIGADSNFFNLGGSSLKAIQLLSKLNRSYDLRLSYTEFSKDPSMTRIAHAIETKSLL